MSIFRKIFSNNANQPVDIEVPPVDSEPIADNSPVSFGIRYERGGTILLVVCESDGDALKELSLELVRPFRGQCRDIIIVDEHPLNAIASIGQGGIWFVMSFFGVGQDFAAERDGNIVNIWADAGIPFLRIFGDTPAYFPEGHRQSHPNSINLYGHPEHYDFYRQWIEPNGLSLRMLPILFDRLDREPSDLRKKIANKTIVFPKNSKCPEKLMGYWRDSLSPTIARALVSLVTELTSGEKIDKPVNIANELLRYYADLSIDLGAQKHLLFFLTAQIDDYLRRYKSTLIAKSLLDFPIVVRGQNWDHIDFSGRRARLDTDANYVRTRQVIDDALAIIDMTPNIQNMHDRVQRAAGRYTAFLTNRQDYLVKHFDNYKSFTYAFNPDSIRERVDYALSNPAEVAELGLMQARKLRQVVSEEIYTEQLINAVDICALAIGGRPEATPDNIFYPPTRG